MKHPYWARREIARLDRVADARRIAKLLFEVRYGSPLFVHTLFSVAFARQVVVPAIADVLYRDGKGIIIHDTAKRNDDTLVFFGLLFRHVGTPEGEKVVERIMRMHARYPIPNELNLYTLSTLACLPRRIGWQFAGRELLSAKESESLYRFWRQVGELMGITDIPANEGLMLQWMLDYEAANYRHTVGGREVTMALAREFATRWFPPALQELGERLYYAACDEDLRRVHRLPEPTRLEKAVIALAISGFFRMLQLLPDPAKRDLLQMFGQAYGARPESDQVGPQENQ